MLRKLLSLFGPKKLHIAAQEGDVQKMRKLINNGADVNAVGPQKATPLFFTANTGSVEAARLLLNNGADINFAIPEGGTALHSALLKGHADLALFLIDKGADIHKATYTNVQPLHVAALSGLPLVVRRLIQEGADIHAVTAKEQNPLLLALLGFGTGKTDDPACVRMLFRAGCDPRKGNMLEEGLLDYISESAQALLREELESLIKRAGDDDLRRYVQKFLGRMNARDLPDRPKSAVLGPLTPSDEPGFEGWWECEPILVPFWDEAEATVLCEFDPATDKEFIAEADAALSAFLKKTPMDRLTVTPLLDAHCRAVYDAPGHDPENRDELWEFVTPPKAIHVRRHRDRDIYVAMDMECDWEEERGVRLVFRKGEQCTRVSQCDGYLTDADALGVDDAGDVPLAKVSEQ